MLGMTFKFIVGEAGSRHDLTRRAIPANLVRVRSRLGSHFTGVGANALA